jgi:8-oxo-dGTP pyrophosphatase MutT (NUDIX family)
MNQHFVGEITQKAIISHNSKIILTRDLKDSLWEIPGGRLHLDEQPYAGVEREIFEEIGLHIKVTSIFEVTITAKNKNRAMIVYLAELLDDPKDIKIQEEEIADYKWVEKGEWESLPIFPEIKPILTKYFSLKD